ncbi:DnaJ-domain-containing protein [Russula ochroleuca]|jgi:DnaJ family protein C protein 8|uniref:DnaJ-domain-containing protein n=1 Tax=Russula ochroleuca TaxID=152965 RepID=A0A9P5N4W8_9AGAM|nr:DnaJ-domain-containing protein [Russula ochroleuca]
MSKDPSASNTPAESSTPAPELSDADLERLLNREASAIQRELEVERILIAFKLNPYDVLDLGPSATAEDIKKKYRQLSLFIHPDKCTHARAPEAFDVLKKAENELGDTAKREDLDAAINQARLTLLKELSLPTSTPDDHPRLKGLTPPFKAQLRQKSKELLIEEEVRRRRAVKMNLANEGFEARKKEEEVAAKKRKAEDDARWEETREQRVGSWRTFTNTSKKKKKQKGDVLG